MTALSGEPFGLLGGRTSSTVPTRFSSVGLNVGAVCAKEKNTCVITSINSGNTKDSRSATQSRTPSLHRRSRAEVAQFCGISPGKPCCNIASFGGFAGFRRPVSRAPAVHTVSPFTPIFEHRCRAGGSLPSACAKKSLIWAVLARRIHARQTNYQADTRWWSGANQVIIMQRTSPYQDQSRRLLESQHRSWAPVRAWWSLFL